MTLLAPMLDAPTYARARLRLGITGVGAFVVLSAAAAVGGLPGALFDASSGGLLEDAARLAMWLAGAALLALPFRAPRRVHAPRALRPQPSRARGLARPLAPRR